MPAMRLHMPAPPDLPGRALQGGPCFGWAAPALLVLHLLAPPSARGAPVAAALPADRLPVLLLDLSSAQPLSPSAIDDLRAALGKGVGRTERYVLAPAPAALRDVSLRDCFQQDCLRRTVGRPAGYLIRVSVEVLDKDYSFRLRIMDAADPSTTQEVVGSCDICSFAEACQALEDLAALLRLRTPVERRDPLPSLPPAGPAVSPPAGAGGPRAAPGAGVPASTPGAPPALPAAAAPGSPALARAVPPSSPAPPPAAEAERQPRPPGGGLDRDPATRSWPPGWTMSGGSVGHSSRAVGWGLSGAGLTAAMVGGGMVNAGSAGGAAVGALGLAAVGVGLVVALLGDRPPPFSEPPGVRPSPAAPASATGWAPPAAPPLGPAASVSLRF